MLQTGKNGHGLMQHTNSDRSSWVRYGSVGKGPNGGANHRDTL